MTLQGAHQDGVDIIHATHVDQYKDLLTGVMSDQPVAIANSVVAQSFTAKANSPYVAIADPGTVVDAGPTLRSVVLDATGRILSATINGGAFTFTYGADGRPVSFTALGLSRTLTRDASGRVTGVA